MIRVYRGPFVYSIFIAKYNRKWDRRNGSVK